MEEIVIFSENVKQQNLFKKCFNQVFAWPAQENTS